MIWHILSLIFRWNSIIRWNNFPRIENTTQTENLALVLHICTTFADILEEKENIKIDLSYIYKKVFFESLNTFVLSDINSWVKNQIRKIEPEMITKLNQKVYNVILDFELPEKFKSDFKDVISKNPQEYQTEELVFKFAKLLTSKIEIMYNYKVFTNIYKSTYENLESQLNQDKFSILNKYLNDDLFLYFEQINRLKYSQRWNHTQRVTKISVMSHLYIVFCISYILWILEEKNDFEIFEMMKKWLYHDIPEAITGDIVTPTKSAIEWFRDVLSQVEKIMLEENILNYLWDFEFKNHLNNYILEPFDDELWKIVKIADIFSALLEAKIEADKSEWYKETFTRVRKVLNQKNFKSIDYMMKNWVDYFDDNLDHIIILWKY